MQVGNFVSMRNDGNRDLVAVDLRYREADAFNGDRSLFHHVTCEFIGYHDLQPVVIAALELLEREQLSHSIDVALNNVPTQRSAGRYRQLKIHQRAFCQASER